MSTDTTLGATEATDVRSRQLLWLRRRALGGAGLAFVVALWAMIVQLGFISPSLFPGPWTVAKAWVEDVRYKGLLYDVGVSALRVIVGVSVGLVAAIPVGFVLAWFQTIRRMFEPVVNFFRSIPPIALSPLVIVYLGIGETARVSVLVFATFFTTIVLIFEGVSAVEDVYIRAARTLGASEWEIFRRIVVPLLVPQIFVALRLAVGISWATLVAAELIAAERGLGAVIQNAGNFFDIPTVYVGILSIGIMALIMDALVRVAMRRAVSWQERVER